MHLSSNMAKAVICMLLASLLACYRTAPVAFHGGSDALCPLTVKILDAVKGTPAGNIVLDIYRKDQGGAWEKIASGKVDMSGEVHNLISEEEFTPGLYRVEFDTKAYWKAEGRTPFHQVADVVFEAHAEGHRHYTLALLLSPFSYTTTAVVVKAHE
ncbi:transthyretin [Puntigrus tetrazona]|uniref:transthyretin n=1 Tax=Puntigrus tetrazona TaxID=1606681 RepID=UPI001C8A8BD4|nr:transthyretin [Puntigrus tetrazona]